MSTEIVRLDENHSIVPTAYLDKMARVYYLYLDGHLTETKEADDDGQEEDFEDLEDAEIRVIFGEQGE